MTNEKLQEQFDFLAEGAKHYLATRFFDDYEELNYDNVDDFYGEIGMTYEGANMLLGLEIQGTSDLVDVISED